MPTCAEQETELYRSVSSLTCLYVGLQMSATRVSLQADVKNGGHLVVTEGTPNRFPLRMNTSVGVTQRAPTCCASRSTHLAVELVVTLASATLKPDMRSHLCA